MSEETQKYPFKINELKTEENAEIFKLFRETCQDSYFRIGPKGYCFVKGLTAIAPKMYNMAVRPNDTWVVTFPKAGTTWTQELVWLVANDFDYAAAAATPLMGRFPFLELSMFFATDAAKALVPLHRRDEAAWDLITKSFEIVSALPSPRFIKSHMPLSLLPPSLLDTCRMVYVARDPRDVAVSYYHHVKFFKMMGYTSDFKNFWNLFIKDMIDWAPFFSHLKEAWEQRSHPNMLFLFYEDMKKDLPSVLKQVAKFLGKTVTEEQVSRACEHLSFDNFKNNESVNMDLTKEFNISYKEKSFCREGKAGGWRQWFDEEMVQQADRWMADNLRNTDMRFPTVP